MSAQTTIPTYTSGQMYDLAKAMLNINELDSRTKSTKLDFNNIQKLGDKLEPIEQEYYQRLVNNISLSLSWGEKMGATNAYRSETYPTSPTSTNQPMQVYLLIANLSHWSKISALSPKIRVERFRRQKARGTSASNKKRTGSFKYALTNIATRPREIVIPSASFLLDIKPEKYFKMNSGYPNISGDGTKSRKYRKQLIQFKIEITVSGVKIVSQPLTQIKIKANKFNNGVTRNIITYSRY